MIDLTVVIPSVGRAPWLQAMEHYWRGLNLRVVVARGADAESHVPVFSEFASRLLEAVDQASTEFIAVVADDDVFTWTGLNRAISTLVEKPHLDYIVGRTLYWQLVVSKGPRSGRFIRYRHAYRKWSPFCDVVEGSALERSRRRIYPLWSVARTESFHSYLARVAGMLPANSTLGEIGLHYYGRAVMLGEMLDLPLWIRRVSAPHHHSIRRARGIPSLEDLDRFRTIIEVATPDVSPQELQTLMGQGLDRAEAARKQERAAAQIWRRIESSLAALQQRLSLGGDKRVTKLEQFNLAQLAQSLRQTGSDLDDNTIVDLLADLAWFEASIGSELS